MGGPNITVPRDRTVDVCKMIWTPYPPSSFSLEVEGEKNTFATLIESTLIFNAFSNFKTHVSLRAKRAAWDQSSQVIFIFPLECYQPVA